MADGRPAGAEPTPPPPPVLTLLCSPSRVNASFMGLALDRRMASGPAGTAGTAARMHGSMDHPPAPLGQPPASPAIVPPDFALSLRALAEAFASPAHPAATASRPLPEAPSPCAAPADHPRAPASATLPHSPHRASVPLVAATRPDSLPDASTPSPGTHVPVPPSPYLSPGVCSAPPSPSTRTTPKAWDPAANQQHYVLRGTLSCPLSPPSSSSLPSPGPASSSTRRHQPLLFAPYQTLAEQPPRFALPVAAAPRRDGLPRGQYIKGSVWQPSAGVGAPLRRGNDSPRDTGAAAKAPHCCQVQGVSLVMPRPGSTSQDVPAGPARMGWTDPGAGQQQGRSDGRRQARSRAASGQQRLPSRSAEASEGGSLQPGLLQQHLPSPGLGLRGGRRLFDCAPGGCPGGFLVAVEDARHAPRSARAESVEDVPPRAVNSKGGEAEPDAVAVVGRDRFPRARRAQLARDVLLGVCAPADPVWLVVAEDSRRSIGISPLPTYI